MEEETTEFLTSDFFKTLISVIIGGLISFISVLIIEIRKSRKEKKERKRRIYRGIISTVNIIRRYENRSLKNSILFNYHKRLYSIEPDEISKIQAEYHQNLMDDYSLRVLEKTEFLDNYAVDYHTLIKNDEKFQEILNRINKWKRPKIPTYNSDSSAEATSKIREDQKRTHQEILDHFSENLSLLQQHMKKKLDL